MRPPATWTPRAPGDNHASLVKSSLLIQVCLGLRSDSNLSKLKPWLGHGLSVVPTKEWQDNLSKLLGIGQAAGGLSTSSIADRPVTQRRRMNEEKSLTTLQTLEATGKQA